MRAHISTTLSKHVPVASGQTEIWAFLAFGLFHLSLLRKVVKAPEKWSPMRKALWGTIFHALGMAFRLVRAFFVPFWL